MTSSKFIVNPTDSASLAYAYIDQYRSIVTSIIFSSFKHSIDTTREICGSIFFGLLVPRAGGRQEETPRAS